MSMAPHKSLSSFQFAANAGLEMSHLWRFLDSSAQTLDLELEFLFWEHLQKMLLDFPKFDIHICHPKVKMF